MKKLLFVTLLSFMAISCVDKKNVEDTEEVAEVAEVAEMIEVKADTINAVETEVRVLNSY